MKRKKFIVSCIALCVSVAVATGLLAGCGKKTYEPEASGYLLIPQEITASHLSGGTVSGGQGANFINGELWCFGASADGHKKTDGDAYVYSVDWDTGTFTQAHSFTHNFGHMNSLSYDAANDNLIFGNGSGSYRQKPEFYVVKIGNMNLDGANTLDNTGATVFTVPHNFGVKCNVIWTDVEDVAVMMADDATVFRRIRLARGTEQLAYGKYASATQTGYNGTWEVLDIYTINDPYEVLQGAAYIDGKIFMGFGHGVLAIGTAELLDDGQVDYRVWEHPEKSTNVSTVWFDETTGRYGCIRSGVVWIWDSLPITLTGAALA